MAWTLLFIAGLFEIIWALGLKYSQGFSKPLPSVITIAAMFVSFYLLSYSMKTLPMGTAYAVWTGIGATGIFICGVIFMGELLTLVRGLSVLLIAAGIAGLKIAG
ncbi:MAG: quaternary ammonium compound efflux SMR transporter SugE [Deferribacterales bacterium]